MVGDAFFAEKDEESEQRKANVITAETAKEVPSMAGDQRKANVITAEMKHAMATSSGYCSRDEATEEPCDKKAKVNIKSAKIEQMEQWARQIRERRKRHTPITANTTPDLPASSSNATATEGQDEQRTRDARNTTHPPASSETTAPKGQDEQRKRDAPTYDATKKAETAAKKAEMAETAETETKEPLELEDWADFIRRSTGIAEEALAKTKLEDWIAGQRRRKWRWAGHVARRKDNRWSNRALHCIELDGRRPAGHPKTRWRDSVESFISSHTTCSGRDWPTLAQNGQAWKSYEDKFVQFCYLSRQ